MEVTFGSAKAGQLVFLAGSRSFMCGPTQLGLGAPVEIIWLNSGETVLVLEALNREYSDSNPLACLKVLVRGQVHHIHNIPDSILGELL